MPRVSAGAGEMASLIRAHDWSKTPLGPADLWPQPLKTLVDVMLGSNQPMFIAWGPQRTFLYNDAYTDILAAKHPQALGCDFLDAWSEIRADLTPIVEQAYAGQPVHMDHIELIMQRRGYPEETHFAFSYTPIHDEAGAVGGFFCPCIEITEQVLAERRVEHDRERQRTMLQQMPGFVALLSSPEHRYDFVNDAYREIAGDRDFIGRTVREVFPEVAGQGFFELLDQVYATGEPFAARSMPVSLDREDGDRFIDFLYQPIRDDAGSVTGIFVGGYDVTEQVRAERALRESEAQVRLMADAVPQIVWITDAEGRVEFLNKQWFDYIGLPDLPPKAGDVAARYIHPDDEAGTNAVFQEALRTGTTYLDEHRIRSASGEYRWFLVRGDPYRDPESGEITRWFGASVDIHDRKVAEEALRESEARLAFLDRLGAETGPLADADAVLATTTRLLGEYLKLSVCAYADMDEDEDGFTIRGDWAAPGSTSIVGHYSLADFGKLAVKNLKAGEPLIINDNLRELDAEEAATFQSIGITATICMPLVKHGRLIALMAIHDCKPRVWSEPELSLLREVTARSWAHVERVAAIAELRSSEARYRTLFESIESGFCEVEVDLEGAGNRIDYRVLEANPAFYLQTGFPRGIVNRWLREAEPALEEHWYQAYGRVARTGVAERFEQGSDHLDRWFDVYAFRVGAAEERRVGILFNDISARRTAEEQLRQSEARLRAVVDAAPVGLVFADASGRITGSNARVEEIIGAPIVRSGSADSYGSDYVAFHADGRRVEGHEYPLARVIRGDCDRAELEVQVQLPDESIRWVRYIATPMKDGDGWPIGGVVASLNIDQEKRFTENLAHEVDRAIAELETTQEALRQSQKLEAMGQLTGGVAHDFNNLLTPIIGSLDMLQRKEGSTPRERRLIDGALQSAERAKTLVQRLLAFARRQPLQPQAVQVPALVDGMAELVASTSGPHVRVVVDCAEDLPAAHADPNQLEMAILNLAVNARDAMTEGGTLTISAKLDEVSERHRSRLPPGRYVRLSVADTGAGMDEVTRARAVEPFFSTKGIGRGTGLGLSMVDGLAAQLGGALAIDSKPGLGTCIELWLPVTEAPAEQANDPAAAGRPSSIGTVLLVDDEELVRGSTAEMLADLGYSVVEAGSGEEALRLADGGLPFDLLVTDHLMPGMNGTDLARALLERFPDRSALVVSGYADVDGIANDLPRLSKPFRQRELATALADLRPAAGATPPS